jgi:hypothetical protein
MQHHSCFEYLCKFTKEGRTQVVTWKDKRVCALGRKWLELDWVVFMWWRGSVVVEAVGVKLARLADPAGVEFDPQAIPF